MGQVFNDIQVTAQAEETQVKVGKPIWVQVTLKNLSSQTYYFVDNFYGPSEFFLVVQGEQHQLVPFLKSADYLAHTTYASSGSDVTQTVPGHGTITYRVHVNHFCAMAETGTYYITVKRKMLFDERKKNYPHNYYVANTVQVEVVSTLPADTQSHKAQEKDRVNGRYYDYGPITPIDPKNFPILSSPPDKANVKIFLLALALGATCLYVAVSKYQSGKPL